MPDDGERGARTHGGIRIRWLAVWWLPADAARRTGADLLQDAVDVVEDEEKEQRDGVESSFELSLATPATDHTVGTTFPFGPLLNERKYTDARPTEIGSARRLPPCPASNHWARAWTPPPSSSAPHRRPSQRRRQSPPRRGTTQACLSTTSRITTAEFFL